MAKVKPVAANTAIISNNILVVSSLLYGFVSAGRLVNFFTNSRYSLVLHNYRLLYTFQSGILLS